MAVLGIRGWSVSGRVPFRVSLEKENRQKPANGRKRRRRLEDAKLLRLREMIAKPLIPLGFAKSRSRNPTLSASLQLAISPAFSPKGSRARFSPPSSNNSLNSLGI